MNNNFWKNQAFKKTLEDLVNGFNALKNLFDQEIEEENGGEVSEVTESDKNTKIAIHFYPGKELSVFINGDKFTSDDFSQERYAKFVELKENKDAEGIKNILFPKKKVMEVVDKFQEMPAEEIYEVVTKAHTLVQTGDFEVKGDSVYMKGINRTLPKALVDRFVKIVDGYFDGASFVFDEASPDWEEYNALKNFWYWIVTNPNAKATEDFYERVQKYNPTFTKEGFILAYRWVVPVKKEAVNTDYISYISNTFIRVKKVNKKSPKNYFVYTDESGAYKLKPESARAAYVVEFGAEDIVGNLHDLYTGLGDMQTEQTYTDGYSRKMDIRIGKEVSMPRKECDESTASCSKGLHACFNLSDHRSDNFGQSVKILVAICPRNIVSAPYSSSKFRSCSYLPLAVLKDNEDDSNFLKNGEGLNLLEEYLEIKKEELRKEAEENTVEELQKQHLLPARITSIEEFKEEVKIITTNLGNINVKSRVKKIN